MSEFKRVGQYRLLRKIGKGATCQVFEGRKDGSSEKFAIKMMSLKHLNEEEKQMIVKEANIIKSIQHPNIVHLHDNFNTNKHYYLVFELCEQGDLETHLMEYYGPRIPQETAQRIIFCIADAVSLIHSKGIAHRDIKLANILLKKDYKIKLADFGFAKTYSDSLLMETYCGTPITMAPQILQKRPYDKKCDIWSLGIILFQLVYGKLPFSIRDGLSSFIESVTEKSLQIPSQPPMPIEFKELLMKSLEKDPARRYGIEEFLQNKWVMAGKVDQSPETTKKGQSVEELLRNISHEYKTSNKIEKIQVTDSYQVEVIIGQRVNKTLVQELSKILVRHTNLRDSLKERIKDQNSLVNLLLYLDYKYLEYLWNLPLKVGKETSSQTIKSRELQGIQFPKPLSSTQTKPESDKAGSVLLNYLQKKSQTEGNLQQKIKEYQIVIDIMEMVHRFEIKIHIMFANQLYEDIEVDNVIENIKNGRIKEEVNQDTEFQKGNFITIAIECYDKDDRMKTVRENFVTNCKKRINQIQKQINGH